MAAKYMATITNYGEGGKLDSPCRGTRDTRGPLFEPPQRPEETTEVLEAIDVSGNGAATAPDRLSGELNECQA